MGWSCCENCEQWPFQFVYCYDNKLTLASLNYYLQLLSIALLLPGFACCYYPINYCCLLLVTVTLRCLPVCCSLLLSVDECGKAFHCFLLTSGGFCRLLLHSIAYYCLRLLYIHYLQFFSIA